ncbi:MAG: pyrroline-5-carboxylate reductase [Actinobacteria bacterium]|nr:pyrroline-5-carboxylate reductase [Actinomycetota bacterium]
MDAAYQLAIIGGGRMGEALAAGIVSAGALSATAIAVAEPSDERREAFTKHGIRAVADGREIVRGAGAVLLAVKPQVIDGVVADLAEDVSPGTIVVSIAAGITTARIEACLPEGCPVVRVMPNTPAMVGAGMAVVSGGRHASAEQTERVRALFEAVGEAVIVDEAAQDAATAISGSGPAYVALIAEALADAGERQGLSREVALRLAIQTFRGTAELLDVTGMAPQELVDAVSSPGGTTVAAIGALESGGIRSTISAAVEAAVRRAKELGA